MEAKLNPVLNRSMALLMTCLIAILFGCEQEFVPEVSQLEPEIVVEGYVQTGPGAPPVYILLSRSLPFFSEIGPEELSAMFIRDAEVVVNDGEKDVVLQEICLSEVPAEIRDIIAAEFGFASDSFGVDICVYLDLLDQVVREPGRQYSLRVTTNDKTLAAMTTTPLVVGLDTLYFAPPPDPDNDTMAQLRVSLSDPPGIANFYRYFMQTNDGSFVSDFGSITDDVFFDGKEFEFQLLKPEGSNDDVDFDTFGLYDLGDTMTVKWATIDKAHFDFWNTLEFSQANQGPFANYTRINGNIEGGLGIWGGYTYRTYTLVVEY